MVCLKVECNVKKNLKTVFPIQAKKKLILRIIFFFSFFCGVDMLKNVFFSSFPFNLQTLINTHYKFYLSVL